ncbi:MAG: conserved membrane protein of unknown function [Nitrosopumilales archaeon]|nr:MAG: conserved membrane protein of unknown function [Nitrosopumilales archaeon]
MKESSDNVTSIAKRYKLTLFNPFVHYQSLIISVVVVSAIVATTVFGYLKNDDQFFVVLVPVIVILLATQYLDSLFTKKKEYSKSIHASLFGNILWLLTLLAGLVSTSLFSNTEQLPMYITVGMFLFASFRIGIFTSVLGTRIMMAWVVCFIQPFLMFLALVPVANWESMLTNWQALSYGAVFLVLGTAWSFITDRVGKPKLLSTHKFLQAYISALSQNQPTEMELLMDERSHPSKVSTSQIRLYTKNNDFRFVLPDIHPGPFHPIGGSNITYLIYKNLNSSAMILHSVSDHSLNLPSKAQVEIYIQSFANSYVTHQGRLCTIPVTVQVNKTRVVGILFDKIVVLILSLSPHGMEDLPLYVKNEIEHYAKNRGFEKVLIVDSHNAMGKTISSNDSDDLLKAAKSNLDTLMTKETFPIEIGYANSQGMNLNVPELGMGGIGILCLKINGEKYFIGWADSNNMKNGVREDVVNHFSSSGYNLLEICTSDTHYSPFRVHNKQGYHPFGSISKSKQIADWFLDTAKKAEKKIEPASFELIENQSDVKVMGSKQFEEYSRSLDKAMNITKAFLIATTAFFFFTMF